VLKDDEMAPGRYVATWDGRNQAGEGVSSGVYFYSMEAEKYKATKKMLVVK
jgi:flagellar hook assembly protein FlgD